MKSEQNKYWIMIIEYFLIVSFFVLFSGKVERADLMCDVIKKVAPFVLSKLWILVADWSMSWSRDTFLIKLRLYLQEMFYTEHSYCESAATWRNMSWKGQCIQIKMLSLIPLPRMLMCPSPPLDDSTRERVSHLIPSSAPEILGYQMKICQASKLGKKTPNEACFSVYLGSLEKLS